MVVDCCGGTLGLTAFNDVNARLYRCLSKQLIARRDIDEFLGFNCFKIRFYNSSTETFSWFTEGGRLLIDHLQVYTFRSKGLSMFVNKSTLETSGKERPFRRLFPRVVLPAFSETREGFVSVHDFIIILRKGIMHANSLLILSASPVRSNVRMLADEGKGLSMISLQRF